MTEPKAPKTMWEWMRDRYLERQARKEQVQTPTPVKEANKHEGERHSSA